MSKTNTKNTGTKTSTKKPEGENPTPVAINVDAIKAGVVANAHPAANLFPMMSGDEFANLCLSIRQHGFDPSKPIKRNSAGKTTDGRNREAATQVVNAEVALWNADPKNADKQKEAVVPVYVEEASDNDASILDTVLIDNLNRRHLSSSQKAAVLVKAGILGGAYQRKEELGEAGKRVAGDIAEMIAAQHGVNHDYIYKVKAISKTAKIGKGLLEQIASGDLSVMAAYAKIKEVPSGEAKEGDNNGTDADAILDGTKKPVAEEWKETFAVREKFAALAKLIRDARAACKEIAAAPGGQLLAEGNNLKEVLANFGDAAKSLRNVEPHVVCPHCDGTGKHPEKGDKFNCPVCGGLAFLTEPQHERFLKHGVMEEGEATAEGTAEGQTAPAEAPAAPAAPKGKKSKAKPEAAAPAEATSEAAPAEATAPASEEPAAV
jgi:hypothetical protein